MITTNGKFILWQSCFGEANMPSVRLVTICSVLFSFGVKNMRS